MVRRTCPGVHDPRPLGGDREESRSASCRRRDRFLARPRRDAGATGGKGSSFSFYDPQREQWRQLWVWRSGTTIETAGHYEDGKMILEGETQDQEGKTILNRITFYDNPDGTVRQHWKISRDGGKTWQTSLDGLYAKKK